VSIVCSECGGAPMIVAVAHPIWWRGTTLGKGECRFEQVAYCPKCEDPPSFHGSPQYYDESYDDYVNNWLAQTLDRRGPRGSF
jgi:hypothetical protein